MKLVINYLKKSINNHPIFFVKVVVFSLLITIFNICPIYVLQLLLNHIEEADPLIMAAWVLLIIVLLIINAYMNGLYSTVLDDYGGVFITKLMNDAEESLDHSSMNDIDELDTANIKHILFGDCLDIFRVIGHHMPMLLSSLLLVISGLFLAGTYSTRNSLLILLSFVLGILISLFSRSMIDRVSSGTNEAIKDLHGQLNDYVDALPYSKINGFLAYYQQQTSDRIDQFISRAKKEDQTINFWSGIISNYNLLISIVFSALLALPSASSAGEFAFFMVLLSVVLGQGQETEVLLQNISKSMISFRNYDTLVNLKHYEGSEILSDIDKIEIRNVSFHYVNKDPVLNDLTLDINKGDCIRLKGNNGSGKSTFLKLLIGLYEPQEGSICINGKNLTDYRYADISRNIIYLGQDEPILDLTVDEYLKEIRPDVTSDEIDRIHKLLNLPDGDFKIEHNGSNLSGGQKKKMIIAKMLLKEEEASMIILDEIEAGLDVDTLKWFTDHVNEQIRDNSKIFLIITHLDQIDYHINKNITF